MPLARTYDHIGTICRSVADLRLMLGAMAPEIRGFPAAQIGRPRIGALVEPLLYCDANYSAEVGAAFDEATRVATKIGARVSNAKLPTFDAGRIIEAEAFRYHAPVLAPSAVLFDRRTLALIMSGSSVSDAELAAQQELTAHKRALAAAAFEAIDLVIVPTVLRSPPTIRESEDPFDLTDVCTFLFNQLGLPAITAPFGEFADGMPMGLTIAGPPHADATVLAFAEAFQNEVGRGRRPVL